MGKDFKDPKRGEKKKICVPLPERELLRQGDIRDISATVGCSNDYVNRILAGVRAVDGVRAKKAKEVYDEILRTAEMRKTQPPRTRGKSGSWWKGKREEQA